MVNPQGSIHNKTHSFFGHWKTVFKGRQRDKDTPLVAPKSSTSVVTADPDIKDSPAISKYDISQPSDSDHNTKGFWQMAYDDLKESDPNSVAALFSLTGAKPQDAGDARTREILDEVVEAVKAQYREKGEKDGIRATAHKILNSVLSFQDVVSNIAKFDPTGYTSSAWAIVSLGLTMAKNHTDRKGALFDASEYLADLLTRCAFIEEHFYGERDPAMVNFEKERSIVRMYMAILCYSAEVRRVQQSNKGKDIMDSITAITSQPLTQLMASIKEEESHLHQWLDLDQHLRRGKEAEAILNYLDQLTVDIHKLRDAVDMLNLPFAKGAFFGSFEDQHEDECLAGTRTELLRQVQDWSRSSDRCIFWLSGMAGTGKSTIARTVGRLFKEDGILGASFFFKRGERDRDSAVKFFPTIMKQLAVHIPQIVPGIQRALENDPAIPGSSLRDQFTKLMLQPLLGIYHGEAMNSTVIVIDALDECEPEEDVEIIINLLPKVEKATNMAIRFFLTSRPEIPIRLGFDQIDKSKYQNTILQNLDEDVIKHDIALYLRGEFLKIQQRRRHALPPGWPGEERIEALAMMACPLFIFAATVCRFVADRRFDPDERLQEFSTSSTGSKMDGTYRPVLNQLLVQDATDRNNLIEKYQKIIGVIILLANPLSLNSLAELLLDTPEHNSSIYLERRIRLERQIRVHLDSFHSVLSIPSDPKLPIRTLHLSFHDYLVDDRTKDQEATAPFWVDRKAKHELIASQCLTVMGRYLKKNICELSSYGTSRTQIHPDLIARSLPPVLQYACRYWVYHLSQSSTPAIILDQVLTFLKEHFLHWLEAMGILGMISEAIIAVNSLLRLTNSDFCKELHVFILDARRFILKFAQIVDTAPLQVYSSGLIFAPHKALIRETFEGKLPAWLYRGPKVEEHWDPEMQTLEGHSGPVYSVAFSGDDQLLLLASGSFDRTIKLWDTATGALKHTLEGHSGTVYSVAFSGDGQLLASGFFDKSIKLWDTATGAFKHTLESHSGMVYSVAFSGDGQLLASGSYDRTIKLWDTATGALKHILEGHFSIIYSVVFSGDSQLLASGSDDRTIKLWDTATGVLKHTLKGHSSTVYSVVFSGDGQLLASGSDDDTIKLWDTATGALKHTLEGHSSTVYSVIFSGDGQLLASGSDDDTIKLWDAATGALKHTLEGHSDTVCSVAFSGDGQLLASGSYDDTIKLWDAATGALKHDISTDDVATDVGFSEHLPLLITNIGSFDIRNYYECFSPSSETVEELSLAAGRWVTVQGQKELWIPPNYHPCSSTVRNSTIALGSTSGRVAIIAFSVR
ncbi:WD40 repeat-like protein [Aspergillus vadensis CBS 113365]|uniref:Mitochondrial division protein 1 n=1 Tax=Aspergillus vadensis (strain CBS 113365 / IMI 142717 / IBT 24658) TaxID=1448311 RepID=A0A319B6V7_ASPVC|nr:WD40 repeat-like protein [Aspergillus vadensis CBS 113365]PYH66040.1 WD40 repeat-like protein [Aspergillus vadensis CBS 113365]